MMTPKGKQKIYRINIADWVVGYIESMENTIETMHTHKQKYNKTRGGAMVY
jgi:hypothetical protein